MQLGKQTGSITNHILSRATVGQPEPTVGMGATILAWTDRYAGTIIEVQNISHPIVWVREDFDKRIDANGMCDSGQRYEYTPNPKGRLWTFRFRNGRWEEVILNEKTGRWNATKGNGLRIGERAKYHDFSF